MQKDLFSEFLTLGWKKEKTKQIFIPNKDIVLGDYIIARLDNFGCKIHYLTNGNMLTIPKDWLDIFSVLNTYSGAQVIYLKEGNDSIDNIIYYMLLIITYLDLGRGEDLLKVLGKISEVRTTDFREWMMRVHNIELSPLQFVSIDKIIDI